MGKVKYTTLDLLKDIDYGLIELKAMSDILSKLRHELDMSKTLEEQLCPTTKSQNSKE